MMYSHEHLRGAVDAGNRFNQAIIAQNALVEGQTVEAHAHEATLDNSHLIDEAFADVELEAYTAIAERDIALNGLLSTLCINKDEVSLEAALTAIDEQIEITDQRSPFIADIFKRQALKKKEELATEHAEIEALYAEMQPWEIPAEPPIENTIPQYEGSPNPPKVYDNMPFALAKNSTNGRTSNPKDSMHKWDVGTEEMEQDPRIKKLLAKGTMEHIRELCATHKPIKDVRKVRELLSRAQNADVDAKNELVLHNIGLAVHLAKIHRRQAIALGTALEMEDLVQEGVIGIMRAVELIDIERLDDLKPYTAYMALTIKSRMTRHIADIASTIRIPVHVHEQQAAIYRTEQRLAAMLGRSPTDQEIAAELGSYPAISRAAKSLDEPEETAEYSRFRGTQALNARQKAIKEAEQRVGEYRKIRPMHISAEYLVKTESFELIDPAIECEIAEGAEQTNHRELLLTMLTQLTEREKQVVEMRYGLNGYKPSTLYEVGVELNVTRERIRQIENQTLKKLSGLPNIFEAPDPDVPYVFDPLAGKSRFASDNPYIWRLDQIDLMREQLMHDRSKFETKVQQAREHQRRDAEYLDSRGWSTWNHRASFADYSHNERNLIRGIAKRAFESEEDIPIYKFDPHDKWNYELSRMAIKAANDNCILSWHRYDESAEKYWQYIAMVKGPILERYT